MLIADSSPITAWAGPACERSKNTVAHSLRKLMPPFNFGFNYSLLKSMVKSCSVLSRENRGGDSFVLNFSDLAF